MNRCETYTRLKRVCVAIEREGAHWVIAGGCASPSGGLFEEHEVVVSDAQMGAGERPPDPGHTSALTVEVRSSRDPGLIAELDPDEGEAKVTRNRGILWLGVALLVGLPGCVQTLSCWAQLPSWFERSRKCTTQTHPEDAFLHPDPDDGL